MAIEFDWVTDKLAVGPAFEASETRRLAEEHRIGHVVDLRDEERRRAGTRRRDGVEILHLPTPDLAAPSARMLRDGVAWVEALHAAGRRVLIHCRYGIGRAPTLALCVLVAGGWPAEEATRRLKRARPLVSPSPAQLEAVLAFARARPGAEGAAAASFEALAAIAYASAR